MFLFDLVSERRYKENVLESVVRVNIDNFLLAIQNVYKNIYYGHKFCLPRSLLSFQDFLITYAAPGKEFEK